jgi:type II secretory pathway pseudopilin PulG
MQNYTISLKQHGATIIEMIMVMALMSSIIGSAAYLMSNFSNSSKSAIVAQQMQLIGNAATNYINNNPNTFSTATATAPVMLTVPTLVSANYMSSSNFSNVNAFGQSMCILVLQPTAGVYNALLVSEGGQAVPAAQLGEIASLIGASGGAIFTTNTALLRGTGGVWSLAAPTAYENPNNATKRCDGVTSGPVGITLGHPVMALWLTPSATANQAVLYRNAVPGQPQLNQMNTPLVMAATATVGAPCITQGAIAQNSSGYNVGYLMTCVLTPTTGNTQALQWVITGDSKCYMDASSDLNSFELDARCINGYNNPNSPAGGDWFFLEVYRHVNFGNYYAAQRVTGMTGNSAGIVWTRSQQSGTAGTGWSAWVKYGQFSVDGQAPCCNPNNPAVNVSENTIATGRKPTIQFHSAGYQEGYIALSGNGEPRRINFRDNQGVGLGIDTTGPITAPSADINGSFKAKSAAISGDVSVNGVLSSSVNNWALVARDGSGADNVQPQNPNASLYVNDIWVRSVGKWASQIGSKYASFTTVVGPQVCNTAASRATCPASTQMLSGGYSLKIWDNHNSPDSSIPEPSTNSWLIYGSGDRSCFVPYALCAK